MWLIEEIRDNQSLYYRVHKNFVRDNEVIPVAFCERGKADKRSISMDWESYSTPKESLARARKPLDNGIISFVAGQLRSLSLAVIHSPDIILNNRAHTDVKGLDAKKPDEKTETRLKMCGLYSWEVPIF